MVGFLGLVLFCSILFWEECVCLGVAFLYSCAEPNRRIITTNYIVTATSFRICTLFLSGLLQKFPFIQHSRMRSKLLRSVQIAASKAILLTLWSLTSWQPFASETLWFSCPISTTTSSSATLQLVMRFVD